MLSERMGCIEANVSCVKTLAVVYSRVYELWALVRSLNESSD